MPIGCAAPTPPCRPHQQYSLKNNEELAQQLLNNFDAFRDRKNPGYVSVDSIHAMAKKGWSPNPVTNANIRLANELLRRPELMSALDRHTSTGALDGLIDGDAVRTAWRAHSRLPGRLNGVRLSVAPTYTNAFAVKSKSRFSA